MLNYGGQAQLRQELETLLGCAQSSWSRLHHRFRGIFGSQQHSSLIDIRYGVEPKEEHYDVIE